MQEQMYHNNLELRKDSNTQSIKAIEDIKFA
jgi:hypothetical protein